MSPLRGSTEVVDTFELNVMDSMKRLLPLLHQPTSQEEQFDSGCFELNSAGLQRYDVADEMYFGPPPITNGFQYQFIPPDPEDYRDDDRSTFTGISGISSELRKTNEEYDHYLRLTMLKNIAV
jgi:hypothetical protein